MTRHRKRMAGLLGIVAVATVVLAGAAGYAGWGQDFPRVRSGDIVRFEPESGVQSLGYPYGKAPYPTVPDADSYVCYSDPESHVYGCRLLYDTNPQAEARHWWGITHREGDSHMGSYGEQPQCPSCDCVSCAGADGSGHYQGKVKIQMGLDGKGNH